MMNLDLLVPKDAPKGGSWAWAQIDTGYDGGGDYYVSIRLDGEDADLEATPVFLCDPEEFHSTGSGSNPRTGRTLVQLLDGQVYVYGEGGGMPRAGQADIAAGRYAGSKNGRALWTPDNPAIRVADGSGGWFEFAPTEGGTTTWRNTITAWAGGPIRGMTFYDTTLSKLMAWDGADWVVIGPYTPPAPPVDTGWTNIPLRSGFTALSGETPQYRKIGSAVWLRGRVEGTFSTGGNAVGDLPAGFRPAIPNEVWATSIGTAAIPARFFIGSGGALTVDPETAVTTTNSVPLSTSFLVD